MEFRWEFGAKYKRGINDFHFLGGGEGKLFGGIERSRKTTAGRGADGKETSILKVESLDIVACQAHPALVKIGP